MIEKMDKLVQVADSIEQKVNAAVEHWRDLPDQKLRFRPSENDWSIKEITGHLIDSASNNHQRFVRLQLLELLTFPDYGQDNIHWVRIQNYWVCGSFTMPNWLTSSARWIHPASITYGSSMRKTKLRFLT